MRHPSSAIMRQLPMLALLLNLLATLRSALRTRTELALERGQKGMREKGIIAVDQRVPRRGRHVADAGEHRDSDGLGRTVTGHGLARKSVADEWGGPVVASAAMNPVAGLLVLFAAPDAARLSPPAELACLARHYAITPVVAEDAWFARLPDGEQVPFVKRKQISPS